MKFNHYLKDSSLYKGVPWFYPTDYVFKPPKSKSPVHQSYYADVYVGTFYSFLLPGGLNAFRCKRQLKLLNLDNKNNVRKLIKQFLDPSIDGSKKNSPNSQFYKHMRYLISFKYNLHNKDLKHRTEDVAKMFNRNILAINTKDKHELAMPAVYCDHEDKHSLTVFRYEEDLPISNLIIMMTDALGYDGTYTSQITNPFTWLGTNHLEIVLGRQDNIERDGENKYDWTNWGIEKDFVLPIEEFDYNFEGFQNKNYDFGIYNFYKRMLVPTILNYDSYDFGTINVHYFDSINTKLTKEDCIRGAISIMNKLELKFLCLQEVDYLDTELLDKIVTAAGLYTSVGDFEKEHYSSNTLRLGDRLHNAVISTAKLTILDNKLLPEARIGKPRHFIKFKHPNYKDITFLTTHLAIIPKSAKRVFTCDKNTEVRLKQLIEIKKSDPDIILGDLNITKGDQVEFNALSGMFYALNNLNIESTTPFNNQTDYILSKIPRILKDCMAINYKYSDHKLIVGKL